MYIDQQTIDAINARSFDVLEAYNLHGQLRGDLYLCRCPFHEDSEPSFSARMRGGRMQWNCYAGCGKGADVFSFVAKMEGLDCSRDFNEVARRAAAALNLYISDIPGTFTPQHRQRTELPPPPPPEYIPDEVLQRMEAGVTQTNLFCFLSQLWGSDEVLRVMRLYRVGLSGKVLQGCSGCTAFPSIDTEGNIHAVKSIPYPTTDHHRLKGQGKDMDWYKPQSNPGCYFGLHLLPLFPAKRVALVESEKTALIGALSFPDYIWIATQGKAQLGAARLQPMRDRTIHLFPDVDGLEEWRQRAATLNREGFNIHVRDEVLSSLPQDCKLDIGDVIIFSKQR